MGLALLVTQLEIMIFHFLVISTPSGNLEFLILALFSAPFQYLISIQDGSAESTTRWGPVKSKLGPCSNVDNFRPGFYLNIFAIDHATLGC